MRWNEELKKEAKDHLDICGISCHECRQYIEKLLVALEKEEVNKTRQRNEDVSEINDLRASNGRLKKELVRAWK